MLRRDTIAALSSPALPCGRIIVRLSGPLAHASAGRLGAGNLPPRGVTRARLRIAGLQVPASLYAFPAGGSYTGEEMLEFHLPGSPLLADLLLRDLLAAGARLADPGEFTARAFFNGRLDLTEAEGVAATISAGSERELLAARRLCAGELARRLRPITDQLAELLSLTEAGIDFSQEDIRFITPAEVAARAAAVAASLDSLLRQSVRLERLSHEPVIVLAGRPNAGKSTLLNALCGYQRVVVSEAAGTTRDAIATPAELPRGRVQLVDVAGLEEEDAAPDGTPETIRRQMRRQALDAAATADVLLWVRDPADTRPLPPLPAVPHLEVITKSDLALPAEPSTLLRLSARSGEGIPQLRRQLDELAFGPAAASTALALSARHVRQVELAAQALGRVPQALASGEELAALEMREALDALGEITGLVSPDDLLTRIFSSFCIGK